MYQHIYNGISELNSHPSRRYCPSCFMKEYHVDQQGSYSWRSTMVRKWLRTMILEVIRIKRSYPNYISLSNMNMGTEFPHKHIRRKMPFSSDLQVYQNVLPNLMHGNCVSCLHIVGQVLGMRLGYRFVWFWSFFVITSSNCSKSDRYSVRWQMKFGLPPVNFPPSTWDMSIKHWFELQLMCLIWDSGTWPGQNGDDGESFTFYGHLATLHQRTNWVYSTCGSFHHVLLFPPFGTGIHSWPTFFQQRNRRPHD